MRTTGGGRSAESMLRPVAKTVSRVRSAWSHYRAYRLLLVSELDAMGYIDQAGGSAAAVVDAEDDLGALMSGAGPIKDAGVQIGDKGRVGELAGNVRTGL